MTHNFDRFRLGFALGILFILLALWLFPTTRVYAQTGMEPLPLIPYPGMPQQQTPQSQQLTCSRQVVIINGQYVNVMVCCNAQGFCMRSS